MRGEDLKIPARCGDSATAGLMTASQVAREKQVTWREHLMLFTQEVEKVRTACSLGQGVEQMLWPKVVEISVGWSIRLC